MFPGKYVRYTPKHVQKSATPKYFFENTFAILNGHQEQQNSWLIQPLVSLLLRVTHLFHHARPRAGLPHHLGFIPRELRAPKVHHRRGMAACPVPVVDDIGFSTHGEREPVLLRLSLLLLKRRNVSASSRGRSWSTHRAKHPSLSLAPGSSTSGDTEVLNTCWWA